MVSCDLSNESYWAVRSCGTVCCDVQDGSTLFGTVLEILLCDLSNEHSSSVFPYRSTSLSRCTYNMKFWRFFFFVFQYNLSEMKTGLSDCSFCFCVIRNPHLLKAPVSCIERLILNILQVSNRTVLKTTLKKVTATLKKRCCMQISY